jgi:hypothetical protein
VSVKVLDGRNPVRIVSVKSLDNRNHVRIVSVKTLDDGNYDLITSVSIINRYNQRQKYMKIFRITTYKNKKSFFYIQTSNTMLQKYR